MPMHLRNFFMTSTPSLLQCRYFNLGVSELKYNSSLFVDGYEYYIETVIEGYLSSIEYM